MDTDSSCDVAIIGGGYTGLSTAYHLARNPGVNVRVLEAGHIGWGASGRNAGFCSLGGCKLGIAAAVRRYGLDAVRHYWRSQVDAIELVRNLVSTEGIEAEIVGDEELDVGRDGRQQASAVRAGFFLLVGHGAERRGGNRDEEEQGFDHDFHGFDVAGGADPGD